MTSEPILATDVKPGDVIATWWGPQLVTDIEPYVGTIPAEGVARFADGSGMTFFTDDRWERVTIGGHRISHQCSGTNCTHWSHWYGTPRKEADDG